MLQLSIAECSCFAAYVVDDDVCVLKTNSKDARTVIDACSTTSAISWPVEEVKEHRYGRLEHQNQGNIREKAIFWDISKKDEAKVYSHGRFEHKNHENLRENAIFWDITEEIEEKEYEQERAKHENHEILRQKACFWDIKEKEEAKDHSYVNIPHENHGNFGDKATILWDFPKKVHAKEHKYGHRNHGNIKGMAIICDVADGEKVEAHEHDRNIRENVIFCNSLEKGSNCMKFPMQKDGCDMELLTNKEDMNLWMDKNNINLSMEKYGNNMGFPMERNDNCLDFSMEKYGSGAECSTVRDGCIMEFSMRNSIDKNGTGLKFSMKKNGYNLELSMGNDGCGMEFSKDQEGCNMDLPMHRRIHSIEAINNSLECTFGLPLLSDAIHALQECKKQKDPCYAIRMYSCICSNGLEAYLGNYIVPLLVECANMVLAQQVLNKLVNPNEYSWGSLLSGFVQCGHLHEALNVYALIKEKGAYFSCHVVVSLLQACSWLKDVQRGRELYMEIIFKGYENDLPIYNSLIFMYSKCCLLTEANSIFVRVPIQDVVSWTTLIAGYVDNGLYMIALECFEEMKEVGVSPNTITFSCVLKACCSIGALDKGRDFHNEIAVKGLLSYSSVAISLISMYANCGSLSEAWDVLRMLPVRDIAPWTRLIQGYIEYGSAQEALKCFDQMQEECISLDAVAFACGLKACSTLGAITKGRDIHGCTLRKGLTNALVIGNSLIGMYAKCGSLSDAHIVFNKMPSQNSISWTALIAGYADHGPGEEAIRLFDEMQLQSHSPNVITFSCVLKACGSVKALERGRTIHSCVSQFGLEEDPLVSNGLVHMYATCGELTEAQSVFDSIFAPDVVLWTALISGYADNGSDEKALYYFEQMQLNGVLPDTATFTCSLKSCTHVGTIGKGYEIHTMLVEKGWRKELSIGNSLVAMYAGCGSLPEAQNVFDMLEIHDVLSWTSLIAGYAEHGSGQEALKCFEKMKEEGICMDAITFASILKACGNIGALQKGREIHTVIVEEEFEEDLSVNNSLIMMYSRCGALADAKDVFDSTPVHDSIAWGSMMKGYCMMHDGNAAIQCFADMQRAGVRPDTVTFTCLLNACSHASLVSEGITYYKQMREQFKIVPTIEHHTCIVDLLGRSGKLYEAENLLSLYPPSEATWSTLLTACRTYGEPELGFRCFQELIEINGEDATWYALMADIFANAGYGLAANHIEQLRKHAGAKKKTAVAIIEVNNEVHEFSVGCIESKEISRALKALNSFIVKEGHVPNLDRVLKPISDDEKEVVLCEHAEKLAIAFGLLSTPQGATLRVTKNLRMCNDCHDVTKMISKIENREIVLRDTSCIHNFKDGMCSCGDLY